MTLYCPECSASYPDESLRNCPDDGSRLYKLDADPDDPLVGKVIDGRFRIDAVLGEGGMGIVYRARQLSVHRDVAIKVLRADLSHKQVALERFFREAKTISNLSHPNIVRLIDFGQDRDLDVLYLVMELVQGFNLADLIAQGRLRTTIALDVLYQACGALTEPHAAGIIHRDLKPDNILLVPMSDGTIQTKVLDFGIARALEQNTQLTATGMICGTPAYMAPEQAQNESVDARTDLYSLGVVFYEMLSGWPPFSGTSSLQIMLKHIQENPTPLRDLVPPGTVIPPIEDLVDDLMNKGREDRPKTAREIRKRIDVLKRDLGVDPIHVEPGMPLDEVIKAWLLPKLPMRNGIKSGPTQVFRRETGMENWLTQADSEAHFDTNDPSIPTLPDSRDERVKVETQRGAQQAWTPGDQDAVRGIKNTNDAPSPIEINVFGATEAVGTPELSLPPRRTVVEDGLQDDSVPHQSTGETRPVTHEDLEAASSRSATFGITGQSSEVSNPDATQETRRPLAGQDRPLILVAIALGIVAIGGALALVYLLTQKPLAPVAIVAPVVEPELVTKPAEPVPNPSMGVVLELAHQKVQNSVGHALLQLRPERSEKTAAKRKPRKPAKDTPKIHKAPDPKAVSKTKPRPSGDEPTYEKLFGKGQLRSE